MVGAFNDTSVCERERETVEKIDREKSLVGTINAHAQFAHPLGSTLFHKAFPLFKCSLIFDALLTTTLI